MAVIAVDVDGTIYPLQKELIEMYNKQFDENLCLEDIRAFKLTKIFKMLNEDELNEMIDSTKYNLIPYDNAVDVINKLSETHRIVFYTSCTSRFNANLKLLWLERFFGNLKPTVVLTRSQDDKNLGGFDIIIDDNPDVIKRYADKWPVLFSQPWNQYGCSAGFVCSGWNDVLKLIEDVYEQRV
jgi:5'(3')-deoxyribonucleotidase